MNIPTLYLIFPIFLPSVKIVNDCTVHAIVWRTTTVQGESRHIGLLNTALGQYGTLRDFVTQCTTCTRAIQYKARCYTYSCDTFYQSMRINTHVCKRV